MWLSRGGAIAEALQGRGSGSSSGFLRRVVVDFALRLFEENDEGRPTIVQEA